MDYRQFMKLMEPGEESVKDSISTLQEFVNEFPYFQSAHALLAKSMHEQQHVRYEKQLKIAAAYAGNRKSLYELIHNKKSIFLNEIIAPVDSPVVSPSISDVEESENIFIESMNEFVISPIEEEISIDFPFARTDEVKPQANFYKEESEIDETETNYYDELPVADPHDIIRKRLIEILGLKEEKKEEVNPESSHVETKIITEKISLENSLNAKTQIEENTINELIISSESDVTKKEVLEQLVEESTKAVDFIQKAEIEYALESTLIQSLEKLPVIENLNVKEKLLPFEMKEGNSFYDWLKIKTSPGYGKFEVVHADHTETVNLNTKIGQESEISEPDRKKEDNEENKTGNLNQLIDRFIEADPKIIPSKTEFYSPAVQAKKSITENEDIVSETLAKIYHQQGNLLKARSSYQKLSLLYPKKMAYFAALISELDKVINNLDKQDL